jgi:hypothetical protein
VKLKVLVETEHLQTNKQTATNKQTNCNKQTSKQRPHDTITANAANSVKANLISAAKQSTDGLCRLSVTKMSSAMSRRFVWLATAARCASSSRARAAASCAVRAEWTGMARGAGRQGIQVHCTALHCTALHMK